MVRILDIILGENKSKLQPSKLITGRMQTEISAQAECLDNLPGASVGARMIGQKYLWKM